MSKIEISQTNSKEIFEFGKHAKQADGAVWLQIDDTVMLATVTYEDSDSSEDFLPLTVQYIEKSYAAGKIPGGFIKRESKPSDFETLTSRVVDRTIRPLFPKGFTAPVLVTVTVLSCDDQADLQRFAVLAAGAALYTSSLPVNKTLSAVRVAKIDNQLVINPKNADQARSSLDLFVSGTKDELLMIEMQSLYADSSELDENELISAIELAQNEIAKSAKNYEDQFASIKKPTKEFALLSDAIDQQIVDFVETNAKTAVDNALFTLARSERGGMLKQIAKEMAEKLQTDDQKQVANAVEKLKRKLVREGIVVHKKRADGRALNEVRPISIETNILPRAHGSCLFTRGQTQALVVATLGSDSDRQSQERLTDKSSNYEKIMLHYNFPGFSVGEAKRIGAPGRRELGHGNLAKRAIESMVSPDYENSIRIVSEILESNGSSSMATVCGATMSLKAAGVPMKKLVAGVAMGLVTEGDEYRVLTDITGLEDHDGDMDFKVAGTVDGITALQMDIKLGGLPLEVLKVALNDAKKARLHILEIMQNASKEIVLNTKALPAVEQFSVDPRAIVEIIGKAGATIRDLIERFDVTIDLERESGGVKVRGSDQDKLAGAVEAIKKIAGNRPAKKETPLSSYTKGDELQGKVVKVADFGLFVELPDSSQGLVHISKVSVKRVARLSDHFKEGDSIVVVYEGQDEKRKISLDMKEKIEVN